MLARWIAIFLLTTTTAAAEKGPLFEQAALRRPIALAVVDEGRILLTANRNSGSVSVVDARELRVLDEVAVGRRIADMAVTADQCRVLVVDDETGELVVLAHRQGKLTIEQRLSIGPNPVRLILCRDGARAYVSSLWARRVTAIELTAKPRVVQAIDLPYSPRELLLVRDDTTLIAADGFGGRLGVIDIATGKLQAVREMPAHNIRGLAISRDGKKLLAAHQILNDLAETSHNDVHWGVLMSNVLRWLVLDNVLDPQAAILAGSHVHLTGDSNAPGADPSAIAMHANGTAIVALSGDHEIGLGEEQDYALFRLPVGRRPTALAISPDGATCYVANMFSDTITRVALQPQMIPPARIVRDLRLGPQPELTLAQRGEVLFYDATLSLDGWFSCHSCHTDGHSIGQLNDNQGDGSFGAAKRILSLLGVGQTAPWAWNGDVQSLEKQVHKSIKTTMQGPDPSPEHVAALTAYLKTLAPPPNLIAPADAGGIARGKTLFEKQDCISCHAPPTYTSPDTYDVGLADKLGNRRFNPPSLLGVVHREKLFHDNRAANLEAVFRAHRHQLQGELNEQELKDLIAFLQSL